MHALISLRSLVSSLNEQQLSPQIFHIVIWRSTCRGCDSFVALGSRLPWPHHDSKLFEQDGDGTEKDPPGPRSESFWDQSELLVKIQDSVLGTSSMPPAKHDFMSEDRGEPRRLRKSDDEDIVRPRFWNEPSRKESTSNLQKACEKMINHEAQLELLLQVELLPSSYIFWPPPPGSCLGPFATSTSGVLNGPRYGSGADFRDKIWQHAVLGIFQSKRTGHIFQFSNTFSSRYTTHGQTIHSQWRR